MRQPNEFDAVNRPDFIRNSGLHHMYFDKPSMLKPFLIGILIAVVLIAVLEVLFNQGAL